MWRKCWCVRVEATGCCLPILHRLALMTVESAEGTPSPCQVRVAEVVAVAVAGSASAASYERVRRRGSYLKDKRMVVADWLQGGRCGVSSGEPEWGWVLPVLHRLGLTALRLWRQLPRLSFRAASCEGKWGTGQTLAGACLGTSGCWRMGGYLCVLADAVSHHPFLY